MSGLYNDEMFFAVSKESVFGTPTTRTTKSRLKKCDLELDQNTIFVGDDEIGGNGYGTSGSGESIELSRRGKASIAGRIRPNDNIFMLIMIYLLGGIYITKPTGATLRQMHCVIPRRGLLDGGIDIEGYYKNKLALLTGLRTSKSSVSFDSGKEIEYTADGGGKNLLDLATPTPNLVRSIKTPYIFHQANAYVDGVLSGIITKFKIDIDTKKKEDDFRFGSNTPPEIFQNGKPDIKISGYEYYSTSDDEWDLFQANSSFALKVLCTHSDNIESTDKFKKNWYMPRCFFRKTTLPASGANGEKAVEKTELVAGEILNSNAGFNLLFSIVSPTAFQDDTTEANSAGGTPFKLFKTAGAAIGQRRLMGNKYPVCSFYFDFQVFGSGIVTGDWKMVYTKADGTFVDAIIVNDGTANFTQDGYIEIMMPEDIDVYAGATVNTMSAVWVGIEIVANATNFSAITVNQIINYSAPAICLEVENETASY